MEQLYFLGDNTLCLGCCDPCPTCVNCSAGSETCPITVSMNGEDLQASPSFDISGGDNFPTFILNDDTDGSIDIDILGAGPSSGNCTFPNCDDCGGADDFTDSINIVYVGVGAAAAAQFELDLETQLVTSLGGTWDVQTAPMGAGFVVTSVTGTATTGQLCGIDFFEDTDDFTDATTVRNFLNDSHTHPCLTEAAGSALFAGGVQFESSAACQLSYQETFVCGGQLDAVININASTISITLQIFEDAGVTEIASVTLATNSCPPIECDRLYNMDNVVAINNGTDPNGQPFTDLQNTIGTYGLGLLAIAPPC